MNQYLVDPIRLYGEMGRRGELKILYLRVSGFESR